MGAAVEQPNHLPVAFDGHRGNRSLRGKLEKLDTHLLSELTAACGDQALDELGM
jgi:hypothetical protein